MMQFTTKDQRDVTVIALSGNVLGGPDANALNEQLRDLLEKDRRKIVLDQNVLLAKNLTVFF